MPGFFVFLTDDLLSVSDGHGPFWFVLHFPPFGFLEILNAPANMKSIQTIRKNRSGLQQSLKYSYLTIKTVMPNQN
jgi:hypothetical protein